MGSGKGTGTGSYSRDLEKEEKKHYDIAWVVDSEDDLWAALAHPTVDGVVSNHPIKLLKLLKSRYNKLCRAMLFTSGKNF